MSSQIIPSFNNGLDDNMDVVQQVLVTPNSTKLYFRGGRFLYASNAYVGLALPGDEGSWQRESKAYLE
ncbi:hypothetical protein JHK87_022633 [Glycine soja]|nr:hypothetical protein JHK87_022633 [Glycine soja]